MKFNLANYGNMPMSTASLALEFQDIRKPAQRIGLLERDGVIIRLKRSLYVLFSQDYRKGAFA